MFETSKDILYVVLAFSVLWLTIFISWMVYYLAMVLREGYTVLKDFRQKLERFDELVIQIKEKLEKSSSYLLLLVGALKQVVEYIQERRVKKNPAKKSK